MLTFPQSEEEIANKTLVLCKMVYELYELNNTHPLIAFTSLLNMLIETALIIEVPLEELIEDILETYNYHGKIKNGKKV